MDGSIDDGGTSRSRTQLAGNVASTGYHADNRRVRVVRLRPAAAMAALAALLAIGAQASPAAELELSVAPLLRRTPSGPCPRTLTVRETPQPYREGSYGLDGRAALGDIATGWRLASRDGFSATWVGSLKAPYRHCMASAGIVRADNAPYRDHAYLRLRFSSGQVLLILDMTGLRDPNNHTPVILSAGLHQGLPEWSWGGSD